MGEKRPSIRTLPSGERVTHHPPDEAHPEGKQVLIRDGSALKDRLDAQLAENKRRHEELKATHADRVETKRADQADKGLPPEKSAF
jgi:hypothetical protein